MNALLTFIEKRWLNTKLILGFGSGLVIAALIGYNSLQSLAVLEAEMEKLYELELLGISHIKEANVNLMTMGRSMRQVMIAQDDLTRDAARAQVATARTTMNNELAEARKRIFRPEVIARYEQFQRNFARHNEHLEHALAMIEREKANPSAAARFITSKEYIDAVNAADEDLEILTKMKERGSYTQLEEARQQAATTRKVAISLLVLGVGMSIGFGMLIGMSIKRPNDRLRSSVEGLASGDVTAPIPHTDYPNEIGIMARAIQVLQGIYRTAEDTRWIKTHGAEIGAALQQAEDFKSLAQTAISSISRVLNAGHGAIYVSGSDGRLNLLGSYGYRERKHLNNSFAVGEGLVGQCAMEKAAITLTAPKDYIQINSGLGEAPPAAIAVLPIVHSGRLLGVLEIASFQQFAERETALLDALMPSLATSMEIMDRNQRTRDLLASTQEQAERMEKQAAQLEEQTVEMEAQQAELLETENWFRSIIETAPDGMLVVNETATIVLANPSAETLLGYAAGELVGLPLSRILAADVLARDAGASGTIQGMHKDGRAIALDLNQSPLPARGRHGRCVSLALRAV